MMGTAFDEAVADIRQQVMAAKARRAKVTPQHWPRASGFWPCDRNMYYQVTAWTQKALPTADKQCLFDFGGVVERAALEDLREAGYRIGGQQVSFEQKLRNGKITGHIDGWISGRELGEAPLPLEVKGYTFQSERMGSWRDFFALPQPWLQAVPCQMQIYLLQADAERGVLLLFDKKGAQVYPLAVELDYEYAESLLARAENVIDYIQAELPPDRIPYDDRICGGCEFEHICQPLQSIDVEETGLVLDEQMEALAAEYLETLPARNHHEAAKKTLREMAVGTGKEHLLVGNAEIEVKTAATGVKRVKIRRRDSNALDYAIA